MKQLLCLLLVVLALARSMLAQTADQLVTQARALLVQNDPAGANSRLESALAIAPNHPDANVLIAATRLMTLGDTAEGAAFLDRLGFSATGRNVYHWLSQVPADSSGVPVAPTNFSGAEISGFVRNNVLPALRASQSNLSRITNTDYSLLLSSAETTHDLVNLDYGDVQLLRALLQVGEWMACTVYSWNADIQLATLRRYFTNEDGTIEQLLADNPHLLTFASTNDLVAARAAFLSAVQDYFNASAFIGGRPQNTVHLFNLDVEQADNELNFRRTLIDLTNSLSAPVVLVVATNLTVHLAHLFDGTAAPRPLLPAFRGNSLVLGSLPDPTLAGMMQGLERSTIEEYLSRLFEAVLPVSGTMLDSPRRFEVQFPTQPGRAYAIEFSADLVSWTELAQFYSPSGGGYTYTDLAASDTSIRYYRLVDLTATYVSVAGQVINGCSGQPISSATVITSLDDASAVTDASGRFFLQTRALPDFNDFNVQAEATGFQMASVVVWGGSDSDQVTLALAPTGGAPPPNDLFANRIVLNGVAPTGTGSTCGATTEVNEPPGSSGSVWWQWTAPFDEWVEIEVRPFSNSSGASPSVYTGSSLATLGYVSNYSFPAAAGETYHLRFNKSGEPGGFGFTLAGSTTVTITAPMIDATFAGPADIAIGASFTSPSGSLREASIFANGDQVARITNGPIAHLWRNVPPGEYWLWIEAESTAGRFGYDETFFIVLPSNDDFANRIPLTGGNLVVLGDNTLATHELDEPSHAGAFREGSVWWTWTAPASGPITITATTEDPGIGETSAVAVYTGTVLADLAPVAANEGGTPYGSQVSFAAAAGVTYQIAVDTWLGGPLRLALVSGAAPSISITSPSNGQMFTVGDPIDLAVTVSDLDGALQGVTFSDDSGILSNLAVPPGGGTATWRFAQVAVAGDYLVQATVSDNQGLVRSAEVYFTVIPPPPGEFDSPPSGP